MSMRLSRSVVGEAEARAVSRVITEDGYLGMGNEVRLFEEEVAQYLGVKPSQVITVNTGTAALTGLTLTDDLGGSTAAAGTVYPLAYVPGSVLYYNGGTVQPAPTVTAGPPMTVTGVTVPAGGNATLVYQARVTEFAAPGVEGEIRNTVTASGGGLATPLTATATTAARLEPELTISKALSPAVVTGNGPLTYTFTIRNTGNTALTGQEGAVITDTFDPILNITGVTFNGTAWTSPEDYTYDSATGAFVTVAGKLTVPGEAVVAIYGWGMAGTTLRGRATVMAGAVKLHRELFPTIPLYGRAATPGGERTLLKRIGAQPVPGPGGLVVADAWARVGRAA